MSIADWTSAYRPDDSEEVSCRHCNWSGTLGDARMKRVYSSPGEWAALAGRDGYEWSCPRCGWMVKTWYWRVS